MKWRSEAPAPAPAPVINLEVGPRSCAGRRPFAPDWPILIVCRPRDEMVPDCLPYITS